MHLQKPSSSLFYAIEKAIKSYRQYSQRQINKAGIIITIDQWLVLTVLQDNPGITQKELVVTVFKDYASITRIIELLVKKKYLSRSMHPKDKRRFHLAISTDGLKVVESLTPIIKRNRSESLLGISEIEIERFHNTLMKIISNCNK